MDANVKRLLGFIAGGLAVLSFFPVGNAVVLLAVAVLLLAVTVLI